MSVTTLRPTPARYSVIEDAVGELSQLADKVRRSVESGDHIATLGALEALGVCRFYLGKAVSEIVAAGESACCAAPIDADHATNAESCSGGLYL